MKDFDSIGEKSPYSTQAIEEIKMGHKDDNSEFNLEPIGDKNFKTDTDASFRDEIHPNNTNEHIDKTIFKGLDNDVRTADINKIDHNTKTIKEMKVEHKLNQDESFDFKPISKGLFDDMKPTNDNRMNYIETGVIAGGSFLDLKMEPHSLMDIDMGFLEPGREPIELDFGSEIKMIGFDNIRVKSPYSIKTIEAMTMEHKVNEHAKLYLKAIVDDSINFKTTMEASLEDEIHLYRNDEKEDKTIFKGLIDNVKTTNVNGIYYIEVEGISGSHLLDIKKKQRSFQDVNMEYTKLVREVTKPYQGSNFLYTVGNGVKIDRPIIQYKETDWELIKRLASDFNSVLVCDIMEKTPRFYFGLPKGQSYTITNNIPYTASKDLLAFKKAGGYAAGLDPSDFFYYEIEIGEQYSIGDEISFKDKQMYVSEVKVSIDKGLLKYGYKLSRPNAIRSDVIYNPLLKGVSLEGKVLEVKGERIKLHLDIDKEQSKATAYWFEFAPPSGNVMYCMPKTGTQASLYFPDATGENAKVLGSVRKNGDSCAKTGNPDNRYFGAEHGSELEITPKAINITGASKKPLKLSLDDDIGIIITSNKKLTLSAAQDITLYAPKKIKINAQSQILVKNTAAEKGFSIENEFHFLGNNVVANGSDRTRFEPCDDKLKTKTKPPFNWGKLIGNVIGALLIVAVVAAAAAVTIASCGLEAGPIFAGAAILGTTGVIGKAISDVKRGQVSDFNDYATIAVRETIIGAVTTAVMGPRSRRCS